MENVFHVKVTKNKQAKTYNLNELLELQNKLMLMSSKGEHGRDQVNKFTQVGSIITIVHQHFAQNFFFKEIKVCFVETYLCFHSVGF